VHDGAVVVPRQRQHTVLLRGITYPAAGGIMAGAWWCGCGPSPSNTGRFVTNSSSFCQRQTSIKSSKSISLRYGCTVARQKNIRLTLTLTKVRLAARPPLLRKNIKQVSHTSLSLSSSNIQY